MLDESGNCNEAQVSEAGKRGESQMKSDQQGCCGDHIGSEDSPRVKWEASGGF